MSKQPNKPTVANSRSNFPFSLSVDLRKCMVNVQNDAHAIAGTIIQALLKEVDHEILKRQVDQKRLEFGVRSTISTLNQAVSVNLVSCDPGDAKINYHDLEELEPVACPQDNCSARPKFKP